MASWRGLVVVAIAVAAAACGKVQSDEIDAAPKADAELDIDAAVDAPVDATVDASVDPAPVTGPGSKGEPGKSCEELRVTVGVKSGVYWVRHPDGRSPAFHVFCEQEVNNGGWALLVNSVGSPEGKTQAFWQLTYPQRFDTKGTPASDQNYYQGSLYLIGTQYMDVFVDLNGKLAVVNVMTTTGIDTSTMRFKDAALVSGLRDVFENQFAAGWASKDRDLDDYIGNCATSYGDVAQHYKDCWFYNLGADTDSITDQGWGPHVNDLKLTELKLALETGGATHSRVKRIARFTRW